MKYPSIQVSKYLVSSIFLAISSFSNLTHAAVYEFTKTSGNLIFTDTYTYDDVTGKFLTPGFTLGGEPDFGLFVIPPNNLGGFPNYATLATIFSGTGVVGFHGSLPSGGALISESTLSGKDTLTHSWSVSIFNTLDSSTNLASSIVTYTGALAPTAAIPEPETYAMFLAGLGLVGFIARRKKVA